MDPSPRYVALLSLLALVPIGIYAGVSGHLTILTAVLTVGGVSLITGSLWLLFGPSPGEIDDSDNHAEV